MRNRRSPRVWGTLVVLVGASGIAIATDSTIEPTPVQPKDGWSDAHIAEFTTGCIEGILAPARRDYFARAAEVGDQNPKPFPETEVRASIAPMCLCLTRRFAQTWAFSEFIENHETLSQPFIREAMGGGQCKPGGILGAVLQKK